MSTQNNSGSAFPMFTTQYDFGLGETVPKTVTQGMTLRDYFAAKADLSKDIEKDGCIEQRLAQELMESPPPNWDNEYLKARIWWLEAEMRLRYLKADAMLRAREA